MITLLAAHLITFGCAKDRATPVAKELHALCLKHDALRDQLPEGKMEQDDAELNALDARIRKILDREHVDMSTTEVCGED